MTALLAILAAAAPGAHADRPDRLVFWPGRHRVDSTAYCLQGHMANGRWVHWGAAASNRHPLGTLIRLDGPRVHGRRYFRISDRIGWGTSLDLWMPSCSGARSYGRRVESYRVVRRRIR